MSAALIKEFEYDAAIEKVWQALTQKQKMKTWYFPQIKEFEPIEGFEFEFDDMNDAYHKKWIVKKVIKNKTFSHSWSYKGYEGQSEVKFDLYDHGDKTLLRVTHKNFESFPDHPHFKRQRFDWGWNNLLGDNLRKLVE